MQVSVNQNTYPELDGETTLSPQSYYERYLGRTSCCDSKLVFNFITFREFPIHRYHLKQSKVHVEHAVVYIKLTHKSSMLQL